MPVSVLCMLIVKSIGRSSTAPVDITLVLETGSLNLSNFLSSSSDQVSSAVLLGFAGTNGAIFSLAVFHLFQDGCSGFANKLIAYTSNGCCSVLKNLHPFLSHSSSGTHGMDWIDHLFVICFARPID